MALGRTFLDTAVERRFPGASITRLAYEDSYRVTRIVPMTELAALSREECVRWVWRSLEPVKRERRPHASLFWGRR